jgi:hypothetical protein
MQGFNWGLREESEKEALARWLHLHSLAGKKPDLSDLSS